MSAAVATRADAGRKERTALVGRVVSALPVIALMLSASMKLSHSPQVVDVFVHKFGYTEAALLPIGVLELTCVLLYVVPRTSVLGALLLTAYLGGAVATHVRVGDVFVLPVVVGILVWVGLYLRNPGVRALAALRAVVTSVG